jgi:hypothetical protein
MAPAEKQWVLPLCYLEKINIASISSMIPDAPADAVMGWFKKEASLRDPTANCYVIAPYIRRTLKEYHKLELGGFNYKEFEQRGLAASQLE